MKKLKFYVEVFKLNRKCHKVLYKINKFLIIKNRKKANL